jgi:hypothetical protein
MNYIKSLLFLAILLTAGCAAQSKYSLVSDRTEPFTIGKLSFNAPLGDDWSYTTDRSADDGSVMFVRGKASAESPAFIIHVWQFKADSPISSVDELLKMQISPFRDFVDSQSRFEVLSLDCNADKAFFDVGVLCSVEVIDHRFSQSNFDPNVPIQDILLSGYSLIFIHPNDDDIVGVVEYGQQVIPDKSLVDTKQSLIDFVGSITLLE